MVSEVAPGTRSWSHKLPPWGRSSRGHKTAPTLCHLRVGHLAGTKKPPDIVISRAPPRGHETAPRHCHLAGVTGRPIECIQKCLWVTSKAACFQACSYIANAKYTVVYIKFFWFMIYLLICILYGIVLLIENMYCDFCCQTMNRTALWLRWIVPHLYHIISPVWGDSLVTGGFSSQRTSNRESVMTWGMHLQNCLICFRMSINFWVRWYHGHWKQNVVNLTIFVVTGGTVSRRNDNLPCHQWRHSC